MHYSSGDDELDREDCISVDKLRTDECLALKIKLHIDSFSLSSPHFFSYLYNCCHSLSAFPSFIQL